MRAFHAIVAGALSAVAVAGAAAATTHAPVRTTVTRPMPAHAAAATGARVVVVDCTMHARVRPHDFLLACGDGSSALDRLHWSRWEAATAAGSGRHLLNDCTPTCVGGTFHAYPVKVTLSRGEPWSRHPGVLHYTRLTLTYPADRPPDTPPRVTYDLWS